jgi:hypothetical protein
MNAKLNEEKGYVDSTGIDISRWKEIERKLKKLEHK